MNQCSHPLCDREHYASGEVRVFLIWVGGERVRVALCPSCAAYERVEEATDVLVLGASVPRTV